MLVYIVVIALIIFIDQWSKKRVLEYMSSRIFPDEKKFITLQTTKNEGAALGFLKNRKRLLITLIMLMMIILIYYFLISFRDNYPGATKLGISMVLGGALGNLIDRVRFKYVRDFFSFNFKKSPIFNIADIFIFAGAVITVCF